MKQPLFTGVCTAMVTPFLEGAVNYPMMERLLKRQMDAGIRSVVICGTTGEGSTLSDAEKLNLLRRCKAFAGNALQILVGTGSNCTAHALELSIAAQENGADGLLVVSPYYNKATDEGLVMHYEAIAKAVTVPVIVYNVPSRTGVDMPVSVYQQLAQIHNIAGVKEASSSIEKVLQILTACPEDFQVWTGNDTMTVPTMALGAAGVISVASNVVPGHMQALTNAAAQEDFQTAAALQKRLHGLMQLLFCEVNPIPVKAAMSLIGYDCGDCRLPLSPLSAANRQKLHKFFS